ncbi:uncharacterized protein LOC106089660 isoform X2 [Stomoxys calcitrans]|uniref:uncharacterized protein LOC106089660 isoform X2 n=1 Tax=Stomoxys calcitrans TaxID=35570 RepID=UPI0027E2AA19|nr:uncharacterized protein LOC106089660 isoform X2 [Stomoxys calcitrans]
MPYVIIRGNLATYSHKYPWRVLVSGLKGSDIKQLDKFSCGGYSDETTIVYLVHPCHILSALEILGYRVVASSSTAVKQDYNEYMWTMRKEFSEPEPLETESVVRENLSNIGREAASSGIYQKVHSPE